MPEPTASDLITAPHVVILESDAGIRLVEFERDAQPSPGMAAHDFAQKLICEDFNGRVIVTVRVRQLQPASYLLSHRKG